MRLIEKIGAARNGNAIVAWGLPLRRIYLLDDVLLFIIILVNIFRALSFFPFP